ncbi:hypothetical protein FOA43_004561 [Brettanomyces nanus]|uniref:Calcineurin-like phosphoesterase domain-containing protein n=1 Tax=Eeniella nana TaxID=13502 RepID=A0A875S733_EENNA|nr:uncharacterized protein FOA43_004561 [Brettanomyces nanus]QPG77156.1 hypothetical protein FOA43_004561 [Brettanomyces nanus]
MKLPSSVSRVTDWLTEKSASEYSRLASYRAEASRKAEKSTSILRKHWIVKRYWPLFLPGLIWLSLFIFFQNFQPWANARHCQFLGQLDAAKEGIKPYNIMLVADPQLIDNNTYPNYGKFALWLSTFTVDNYIYKNYWQLVDTLKPDAVVFLGDLLDNGRESSDVYYEYEFRRFNRTFQPELLRKRGIEVVLNIPGNHDIGFGNGVTKPSLDRFEKHFGKTNQVISRAGHQFVMLDAISLSNTRYEAVSAESKVFLRQLHDDVSHPPRILFNHVPLYRDPKEATCGPFRESEKCLPAVAGYQYQTLINPTISNVILRYAQPSIIFSGDDHDYCEMVHTYEYNGEQKHAIEINVKSISMAMGIWKPAVQLLTVFDKPLKGKVVRVNGEEVKDIEPTFMYSMCMLTPPYEDIIFYSIFAAVNFLFFVYICCKPEKWRSSMAIDDVYEEPKLWNRIKAINIKMLFELCLVGFVVVWFVYYTLFTVHYY